VNFDFRSLLRRLAILRATYRGQNDQESNKNFFSEHSGIVAAAKALPD
jgi:hypothetical protein